MAFAIHGCGRNGFAPLNFPASNEQDFSIIMITMAKLCSMTAFEIALKFPESNDSKSSIAVK